MAASVWFPNVFRGVKKETSAVVWIGFAINITRLKLYWVLEEGSGLEIQPRYDVPIDHWPKNVRNWAINSWWVRVFSAKQLKVGLGTAKRLGEKLKPSLSKGKLLMPLKKCFVDSFVLNLSERLTTNDPIVTKQSTKTKSLNINNQTCKKKQTKTIRLNTNNQKCKKKQVQTNKRTTIC